MGKDIIFMTKNIGMNSKKILFLLLLTFADIGYSQNCDSISEYPQFGNKQIDIIYYINKHMPKDLEKFSFGFNLKIDSTGNVIEVKSTKGMLCKTDSDFIRMFMCMPKWKPAKNKVGKKVEYTVYIPLNIRPNY